MRKDGRATGDIKSTSMLNGPQISKGDLVIVSNNKSHTSLAIVLDTDGEWSYVIYVAGKGAEIKHDPFWIANLVLTPYGEEDE